MTALTLYRIPRRWLRKLLKPAALRLNAWRFKRSEDEAYRLLVTAEALRRGSAREYRKQVKLQMQRRQIGGW